MCFLNAWLFKSRYLTFLPIAWSTMGIITDTKPSQRFHFDLITLVYKIRSLCSEARLLESPTNPQQTGSVDTQVSVGPGSRSISVVCAVFIQCQLWLIGTTRWMKHLKVLYGAWVGHCCPLIPSPQHDAYLVAHPGVIYGGFSCQDKLVRLCAPPPPPRPPRMEQRTETSLPLTLHLD